MNVMFTKKDDLTDISRLLIAEGNPTSKQTA